MAEAQITLTEEVIEVTSDYLGPAARRFIQRQVKVHLNKPLDKLEASDLPALADWSKLALSLLTSDQATVDKFQKDLMQLQKDSSKTGATDKGPEK